MILLRDWEGNDLEKEELHIPEWQKPELDKRLKQYISEPENVFNAEEALYDIDKEL